MLLVICAFTNAFIVLLSHKSDEYFQEEYAGTAGLNGTEVNVNDVSSENNFDDVVKSFSILWFFIYGVWDPVNGGEANDSYMILVMSVLFSFITVLIFFNLVM